MIEIMETSQNYVPKSQSKNSTCITHDLHECIAVHMGAIPTLLLDGERLKTLIFYGDQLTVERARAGQKARIASDTREEALDGLEPAASDWHAEANFLQV